jgi:hypothetical protein
MNNSLSTTTLSRKVLSHTSPTHKIHTDVAPIVSALRHGNKRIANERYTSLCNKLKLKRHESLTVIDIVRKSCSAQGIQF